MFTRDHRVRAALSEHFEPLANKFIRRNFINCTGSKAKEFRLIHKLHIKCCAYQQCLKPRVELRSIPSPQLAIVGWEDNNFLAKAVMSSRVNSSIQSRK